MQNPDSEKTITFETLRVRRLSEVIENYIKGLIMNKTVLPGQRLPTEKEISRQFGVSVVTVREALRGLESFGFIEKKKGKGGGIFVTKASSNPIMSTLRTFMASREFSTTHLAEVRKMLEPSTAKLAAVRITASELKTIEKNIALCESKIKRLKLHFNEKDFYEVGDGNVEFHRLIAEATHNPLLILMMDYAMDFLSSLYYKNIFPPSAENAKLFIINHRDIYERLKAKDAEGVEALMCDHMDIAQELVEENEKNVAQG